MPIEPQPLVDTLKPPADSPVDSASAKLGDQATPPAKDAASSDGSSHSPPTKPEWAGDYWDADKNELKADEFGAHFKALSEKVAAHDARIADVPPDAKDYKLEIPKDLKLPEGADPAALKVDMSDPLLQAVLPILHKSQVPNAVAQELYSAVMASKVAEITTINTRAAEERAALGADAAARVDAIGTFLSGHLGVDHATAMMRGVFTAPQVKGFEALMAKFAGGNIVPFNKKGIDGADEPGKIPGYETMSFEQRRAAQDAAASKR